MKQLRPYQEAAIKSVFQWFSSGNTGNPLVVAPVGAGKSLMIAELVKQIHAQAPHTKCVIVTHVKELLQQNADEMRLQYPDCDYGFYCASMGQKHLHNDVTFASIQSVWNKTLRFPKVPQVIIIDEAHLVSHNEATQYRKFIDACKELNKNCIVIGLTGTPFRSDSGRLDEGDGRLFDGVCYEIEIGWMIEQGYLCKPVTPKVNTRLSVDGVGSRGGDYITSQLEAAVDIDVVTRACVAETVAIAQGRKKWLVFTAGVTHCGHVRDAFLAMGITCEMITGDTDKYERDSIIKRYKAGEIRCLVNVAVLTTGFNVPDIDCLVFMRPTKSPVLYIQCIGRGIRTAQDKQDCMVLDFGGVIDALGPIDAIDIRKRPRTERAEGEEKDKPVMKICPSCGTECWGAQQYCYSCSYSFFQDKLNGTASVKALLTAEQEPETHKVIHTSYKTHMGKGKTIPTLKVTYNCMDGFYSDYICFEHTGYPRAKAEAWFKRHYPEALPNHIPKTCNHAALLEYPPVESVTVKKDGKYWRVLSIEHKKQEVKPEPVIEQIEDFSALFE